jgi:hypothetical protein
LAANATNQSRSPSSVATSRREIVAIEVGNRARGRRADERHRIVQRGAAP